MIVLRGVAHLECNRDHGEERLSLEVLAGLEGDAIDAAVGLLNETEAAVVVGLAVTDDVEAAAIEFERDLHVRRGTAGRCVEDVRGDAHQLTSFCNRRCMIFRCSSAAM